MAVKKIFVSTSLVMTILLLTHCGGDELTQQQKVTKLLTQGTGEWEPAIGAGAIILEDSDVEEDLFPGMMMKFTEEEILTSGDEPLWNADGDHEIWPAEDTWVFKDKNADVLIRGSDGREITIVSISSTELIFQIEWDKTTYEESSGRMASLPGVYTFTLSKN